jgi:hypothetical protein
MLSQFPKVPRAKLSAAERQLRSRLSKVIYEGGGLMRATLCVREKVCGKSNCKCAQGEKHVALYLVSKQDKQVRQLFVPASLESRVRTWVDEYQHVQDLVEQISEMYWEKIRNREI